MALTSKLQAKASAKFKLVTPTFVYMFTNRAIPGIRVEAPDIVREYTDGAVLGRDQKGLLFFHALRPDFNEDREVKYKVTFPSEDEGVDKEIVIVIDFLRPTSVEPFAKFIATLPRRAHEDAVPFEGGGSHWTPLDVVEATALTSTSKLVEINMRTLKKKFTFTVPDQVEGGDHLKDWGYFIVKDVGQIKVGPTYFVDYADTRIFVFENEGDFNPVAVFGSYELERGSWPFDVPFRAHNGKFFDI